MVVIDGISILLSLPLCSSLFTPLTARSPFSSSSSSASQPTLRALPPPAGSGRQRLSGSQVAEDGESGAAGAHHQGERRQQCHVCLSYFYRTDKNSLYTGYSCVCVCVFGHYLGHAAVPAGPPAAEPWQSRVLQPTGPFIAGESRSAGIKANTRRKHLFTFSPLLCYAAN